MRFSDGASRMLQRVRSGAWEVTRVQVAKTLNVETLSDLLKTGFEIYVPPSSAPSASQFGQVRHTHLRF